MKTTCWYEERRNLVGVFDFRSFHRFFVLVARWRWACFVFVSLFCFCYSFLCQGRILSEMCQTEGGVAQSGGCFALPHPRTVRLFGCLFCLVSCMFVCFPFSSHYIYIYGGISFWTHAWHLLWLKSCRLSGFVFVSVSLLVNVVFDRFGLRSISRIFPLVRHYNSWYNTQYRRGTGSCCLCSHLCLCVCKCVFVLFVVVLKPSSIVWQTNKPTGRKHRKNHLRQKFVPSVQSSCNI